MRFLLDVNILVALMAPEHVHHARAHAWFVSVGAWATTPITETGLLRLLTNPAIVGIQVSLSQALQLLRDMHADSAHELLRDEASVVSPQISLERLTSPRDVTDIHLVDLAARHGSVLATLDRGIPELLSPADRRHVLVIP